MPYIILIPAHGLGKLISHLGVCHYITKTHLGGQDTLQTRPPDYIKEGRVPSWAPELNQHQAQGAILDLQTGRRVRHLGNPNLYKSCVSCPCAYLRVLGLPITIPPHNLLPRVTPW
jgi:hypothetical protein